MRRLRALLVGVAEYDDGNIPQLPCVPSDHDDLRAALESHGYSVETPYADGWVGRTQMLTAVSKFLQSAKREDTLLVCLSGHGFHYDGDDYLMPSDADTRYLETHKVSVPLTYWQATIDRSRASGMVFLVDACREGIDESMSITHSAWSPDRVRQAARHQVAWIFPCGPGQRSRYVRGDGDRVPQPFSLFARSVVDALNAPIAPVNLQQFASALREAMDQLTEEHGKLAQDIRLVTNGQSDADRFELFPPEERQLREWERAADAHPVWKRVPATPHAAELHSAALALVQDLASRRRDASNASRPDPWTEAGRFAFRMTRQMAFVLDQLPVDLVLAPAEAALLVTMPFLLDAYEAVQVVNVISQTPPKTDGPWDDYTWWQIHRMDAQPGTPGDESLPALLTAVPPGTAGSHVFTPARLWPLIRTARAENSAFAPGGELGLAPRIFVPGEASGEHELRERLVGILVTVAYRLTIDAMALPGFAPGDHSAFGSVRPADLHKTLERARWRPYGRSRTLDAQCSHPAVEQALREHVARLDELLAHLDAQAAQPDLKDLRSLPVRAVAFDVGPAVYHDRPAYDLNAYLAADDAFPQRLPGSPPGSLPGPGPSATVPDPLVVVPPGETHGTPAQAVPRPATPPEPSPARRPQPVDTDDILRRLLEIDDAVKAGSLGPGLEALLTALADEARWANPGHRRAEFVSLIRDRQLLRADLQSALGPGAVPYNRALLSMAFGLPLGYEAYRSLEDLVGAEGTQDPPPAAVTGAILQDRPPDVRVVLIGLSYLEESQRKEWLAANPVSLDALVDHLADGWGHRAHERRALDSFLWLLPAVPGSAPPSVLRPALSRHGYLAERLESQYADNNKFRVDALRVFIQAAWRDEDFGRAAVDDTLRGGRGPLPRSLIAAVRSLVPQELRHHANWLCYMADNPPDTT